MVVMEYVEEVVEEEMEPTLATDQVLEEQDLLRAVLVEEVVPLQMEQEKEVVVVAVDMEPLELVGKVLALLLQEEQTLLEMAVAEVAMEVAGQVGAAEVALEDLLKLMDQI